MAGLLVVLDFDGTFTDVEVEGRPFDLEYRKVFADLIGSPVDGPWAEGEALIQRDPEQAWMVGGQAVAPATSDPYIRATCIANFVCDELGRFTDRALRTDLLQALYRHSYKHSATAFRPDAKATLTRMLKATQNVYVVTNSDPDAVRDKLTRIGFGKVKVIGNAKKYVVDSADPATVKLADIAGVGLKRPLLVRRPSYFKLLKTLWKDTGLRARDTLVCGDIFELDLALPLRLGTWAHLVERPNTLEYERAAIAGFPGRGTRGPQLTDAAERVEELAKQLGPRARPTKRKPRRPTAA